MDHSSGAPQCALKSISSQWIHKERNTEGSNKGSNQRRLQKATRVSQLNTAYQGNTDSETRSPRQHGKQGNMEVNKAHKTTQLTRQQGTKDNITWHHGYLLTRQHSTQDCRPGAQTRRQKHLLKPLWNGLSRFGSRHLYFFGKHENELNGKQLS